MNISPISANSSSPNFGVLKYQNGMRTKAGLSTELKEVLERYDSDIKNMKNIDILVFDNNNIKLCIKTPRFLNEIYDRFFKDKSYKIQKKEEDSSIIMSGYSNGLWYGTRHKFIPDEVPGIYNVMSDYSYNGPAAWEPSPPMRTLEIARLLDGIMQNIDNTENRYGINCIEVLNNIENRQKEQKRLDLINEARPLYTVNNDFKNFDINNLELVLGHKDSVAKLKNYGIFIDEINSPYPAYIQDKKGYLDDIFNEYYKLHGWELRRFDGGFELCAVGNPYYKYELYNQGDNKYSAWESTYETVSRLSLWVGGYEHFSKLVSLAQKLDDVAKSIQNR